MRGGACTGPPLRAETAGRLMSILAAHQRVCQAEGRPAPFRHDLTDTTKSCMIRHCPLTGAFSHSLGFREVNACEK